MLRLDTFHKTGLVWESVARIDVQEKTTYEKRVMRMFQSLKFLWCYAWRVDKGYLICLVLYQISNSLTPILIMIFPKLIIDEFLGRNEFHRLIQLVVFFTIGIFLTKLLSSCFENTAFYKRCIIDRAGRASGQDRFRKFGGSCLS